MRSTHAACTYDRAISMQLAQIEELGAIVIFAVVDYVRYRIRRGKYGSNGPLRFGFYGNETQRLWPVLREGDVLFVDFPKFLVMTDHVFDRLSF